MAPALARSDPAEDVRMIEPLRLLDHVATRVLHREHAAHDIHAPDFVPFLHRLLEDAGIGARRARVGEEHVEAAELFDAALHDGFDIRFDGDIADHRSRTAAGVADQLHGLFGVLRAPADDQHRGAFLRKALRARAADAAARAGDDAALALESVHRVHPFMLNCPNTAPAATPDSAAAKRPPRIRLRRSAGGPCRPRPAASGPALRQARQVHRTFRVRAQPPGGSAEGASGGRHLLPTVQPPSTISCAPCT